MKNILIKGSSGTGKTYWSRAAAYYLCNYEIDYDSVFLKKAYLDQKEINKFVESDYCEFIQVHSSMGYEDIVYGFDIRADKQFTISFVEKRVATLCNRALHSDKMHSIIFDDVTRADIGALLGNIVYAMEYRNEPVECRDGNVLIIPENVLLIFTLDDDIAGGSTDHAFQRRMDFVKELAPDIGIVERYYSDYLGRVESQVIRNTYQSVESFIMKYAAPDYRDRVRYLLPGHGFYIMEKRGTGDYLLDNFKARVIYQVFPHVQELRNKGVITKDPAELFESVISSIQTGKEEMTNIQSVTKILVNSGEIISPYSLEDTVAYYKTAIIPGRCSDYKGVLESIIDAIILNKNMPYEVSFPFLLTSSRVAAVPSKTMPVTYAGYLVEKKNANQFYYESARKGRTRAPHQYYSTNSGNVGRWVDRRDVAGYCVKPSDGSSDTIYLPLNGLRLHTFTTENVCKVDNPAEIFGAAYRLIKYYLDAYWQFIGCVAGDDVEYKQLHKLLMLENAYLNCILSELRSITADSQTEREKAKFEYFGTKILNLKTLWSMCGTLIQVNGQLFDEFALHPETLTVEGYEEMFECGGENEQTIIIKGVKTMADLRDYQNIMDRIGVRQMIFQGPPGTSKTYESKKFVLKNLSPSDQVFSLPFLTQEDVTAALAPYKLTEDDYKDPSTSSKLKTGGWDLVQFHPSYGYEDFIRGIEVKTDKGVPTYSTVNRILGKIAEFAKFAEQQAGGEPPRFYLIVDEINRANLATVFGELIYGLEYRNSKVSTPYEVADAVSGGNTKDIVLGKNLYIIGTMNTADKSIDAIDYAIRRRFLFVDSPADRGIVTDCYKRLSGNDDENGIEILLFDAVQAIFDNDDYFNSEYQKSDVRLGHTYFLRKSQETYEEEIVDRFVFQIIPILREYVKDGILGSLDDLASFEKSADAIKMAQTYDERVKMLSDNIMFFARDFGNMGRNDRIVDNEYVGDFIEAVITALK